MTRTAASAPLLTAALDGSAYPGTALLSLAAGYFVLGVGSLSVIGMIEPMSRDLCVTFGDKWQGFFGVMWRR